MSYHRVIPRDLFNEANLLKCYGQLYLRLEFHNFAGIELEHEGEAFDVYQQPDSGALTLGNMALTVRGIACELHRPLNSREPWPLYLTRTDTNEVIDVFNTDGTLSADLLTFLSHGTTE